MVMKQSDLENQLRALRGTLKTLMIPFGPNTSETDTGVDLPSNAVVLDVFVLVTQADAGITLDVGLLSTETGGDADGFLSGVSLANTGLVGGSVTITAGSNNTYASATTYGAYLASFAAGQDVADGGDGIFAKKIFFTDSVEAKSISYTCSAGADTASGFIVFLILELEKGAGPSSGAGVS